MIPSIIKGFYFVTNSSLTKEGIESDVLNAIDAGIKIVQYREKEVISRKALEIALRIKKLCDGRALFIVNDRIDIAAAVGADGVHLGQDDMTISEARKILKNKLIGVSTHSIKEAIEAQNNSADYISVGPIFKTITKTDAQKPIGIEVLRAVRLEVEIPIVAIGGITLSSAEEVIKSGADAICAISAVLTAQDIKNEVAKFQKLFDLAPTNENISV